MMEIEQWHEEAYEDSCDEDEDQGTGGSLYNLYGHETYSSPHEDDEAYSEGGSDAMLRGSCHHGSRVHYGSPH